MSESVRVSITELAGLRHWYHIPATILPAANIYLGFRSNKFLIAIPNLARPSPKTWGILWRYPESTRPDGETSVLWYPKTGIFSWSQHFLPATGLTKASNNCRQVIPPPQKVVKISRNVADLINDHWAKSGQKNIEFEDLAMNFPHLDLPDNGDFKVTISCHYKLAVALHALKTNPLPTPVKIGVSKWSDSFLEDRTKYLEKEEILHNTEYGLDDDAIMD